MGDTTERILVIGAGRVDKVSVPLKHSEMEADVVTKDRSGLLGYVGFFKRVFDASGRNDHTAILSFGTRLVGLLAIGIGLIRATPVVIRLGGDIWRDHPKRLREGLARQSVSEASKYFLLVATDRFLLNRATGAIVVSRNLKSVTAARTKLPLERIRVVHPWVDTAAFAAGTEGSSCNDESRETLLTVANLNYEGKFRGVTEVVSALEPLLEERSSVTYEIAGGGRYEERVREFVDSTLSESVRDQIEVHGFVSDVEALYSRADVFLYVSYQDEFPNVLLEAGAAGVPRIVSGVNGLSELIEDDRTGFVLEQFDGDELRALLRGLLDDEEKSRAIGERARDDVFANYTADAVGDELAGALRAIVDGPDRSPDE